VTVKQFGRLDILVNNAGRFMSKPLPETTEADFDQIIALNAKGPYFAMQEAANVLKEGGSIVNISTDGTHLSFPGATAYLGSKVALEQYMKGLAHSLDEAFCQYRLARFYRDGNDDRSIPSDRRADVTVEAAWPP
jgi:3-oxoacyl-[acyl-carrier protein] reductase